MNWAVIHHIHVRTPHRHIARLIIEDVPEDVGQEGVKRALVRAGRQPHEFGIPWANHYVAREPEWPDEVVGAYRAGEAPTIEWDRLVEQEREERKITIRVSPELHAALLAEAERRGVSLQALCVEALERAAKAGLRRYLVVLTVDAPGWTTRQEVVHSTTDPVEAEQVAAQYGSRAVVVPVEEPTNAYGRADATV